MHTKTLTLSILISAPLVANPLKKINTLIKDNFAAPLGNYAWVTAATLTTATGIYAVYKTVSYRNRKHRFSYHEALQDHFDAMAALHERYTSTQNIDAATAAHDLTTLKKNHKVIIGIFDELRGKQHLRPLYRQKDLFHETYNTVKRTIKLFIDNNLQ